MLDDLHVALMIIRNRGHRRVSQRADLPGYSWAALRHSAAEAGASGLDRRV